MSNERTQKAGGVASGLFWVGAISLVLFLLLFPIMDLISGIISTFRDTSSAAITGDAYMSDRNPIIQIMASIMAIFIILLIVFTPTDAFKSPLKYAWLHTMKGADELSNSSLYKEDPDKFKNIVFEVVVFGLTTFGIFAMYVYLINGVTNTINNAGPGIIVGLIGLLINILVIAGLNSLLITVMSKREPSPDYKNGEFIITEVEKESDGGSKLLWGIVLAVVNIVILSIGAIISGEVTNYILSKNISNVLEGEATNTDDLINIFN